MLGNPEEKNAKNEIQRFFSDIPVGKITAAGVSNASETPNSYLVERISSGPARKSGGGEAGGVLIPDPFSRPRKYTRHTQHTYTYASTHRRSDVYAASGPENALFIAPFPPSSLPYASIVLSLSRSPPPSPRPKPQDSVLIYIGLTPGTPFASTIFSKCSLGRAKGGWFSGSQPTTIKAAFTR